MKITKNTKLNDLIVEHPEAVEVFLEAGMHCFGCPMAQMENIGEGCEAHGLDAGKIIDKLNKKLKKNSRS